MSTVPTRILVVDDSTVVLRLVTSALAGEEDLQVVGTAATGEAALAKFEILDPDLVILDVELPDLSGLDVLDRIRTAAPTLPVVVFSAYTERGAATTFEALARGATDCVAKPKGVEGHDAWRDAIRQTLLKRIRDLTGRPTQLPHAPVLSPEASPDQRVEVVAIGASTGGPKALADLLRGVGVLPVPVLIVQHMPPLFTKLLGQQLSTAGAMPAREAENGDVLEPGRVLIAPGDHHLTVVWKGSRARARLDRDAPVNSCRPSVDPLFRSLAEVFGPHVLGVVLTGLGHDGLSGARELRARGAQVVVQDAATSVAWGMPGAIAKAGLAQAVLPLTRIARELRRRVAGT